MQLDVCFLGRGVTTTPLRTSLCHPEYIEGSFEVSVEKRKAPDDPSTCSAGTMQSGYRIPPHPAPKQHAAGLAPARARQDHRPVRLRLALGLIVMHKSGVILNLRRISIVFSGFTFKNVV